MDVLWFFLLLFLLAFIISAWPTWSYTRERWPYARGRRWGYAPSGIGIPVFLFILLLLWFGLIGVWWPWAAY